MKICSSRKCGHHKNHTRYVGFAKYYLCKFHIVFIFYLYLLITFVTSHVWPCFFCTHVRNNTCITHCMKSVQIRSFFWSVFYCIWTEYGEILRISPYLVQMLENMDQKKPRIWTLFTRWLFVPEYENRLYEDKSKFLSWCKCSRKIWLWLASSHRLGDFNPAIQTFTSVYFKQKAIIFVQLSQREIITSSS